MENVRKQFPVLNHCIYANTATSGLLFEDLMEWRQGHDIDFLVGGSDMKFESFKLISETRKTVAAVFGAKTNEVALVPNFSIGFNFLVEGLPKNSNVLLLDTDYPSVNWPIEDRGFKTFYAEIDENLEENIHDSILKNDIDVIVLSIVQWVNGVMIDLEFIKNIKDEFPNVLIMADGTQFCGMYHFNFQDSGVDVLGASAYKWLLAGYGNGFFIVRESAQERFSVKSIGCGSVGGNLAKRYDIPFRKYLEPGHLDSLNFGSLKFALEYLQKIGFDEIDRQNKALSHEAKEQFLSLGLLDNALANRKVLSTIFNIYGDDALFEKLRQENVVCVQRGSGIRLSFHFYNVIAELENIVEIVKK